MPRLKPLLDEPTAEPPARELELRADLQGYFEELVQLAVEERGVRATSAATAYVTGLLADYARPGALNRDPLERSFTLLLAEAENSAGSERFERFRALGDGALYVLGFFSEHLESRGVALRYVSSVGARAYGGAAHVLRGGGDATVTDVFGELADRFDAFVELLGAVMDHVVAQGATKNADLVRLYERWLRTGSSALASALAARGLVPMRTLAGVH